MHPVRIAVARALAEHVAPGVTLVVGTSGGPDSQALLHALCGAGARVVAVGVDHGLRPQAAAELDLAAQLASTLSVPFERRHVEVEAAGNRMAQARAARHRALEAARLAARADWIALGHTASDQAETVLMRLARGTSLRGAGAMAVASGRRLRPLLSVTRDEIMSYLHAHQLVWAEDPTNGDPHYARSRLRHEVVPVLRALNPTAERHLADFAARARDDEAFLRGLAAEHLERAVGPLLGLDIEGVLDLPVALRGRVLALWLERHDLAPSARRLAVLERALVGEAPEATVARRAVRRAGRYLMIEGPPSDAPPRTIPIPGALPLSDGVLHAEVLQGAALQSYDPKPDEGVAFDLDRLHFPLQVRSWQIGDQLSPFGLDGRITLGDLFTDAKIPRPLRARWPLVVHGAEVAWVIGVRRSALAPVSHHTRRAVRFWIDRDQASPSGRT